MLQLQTWLRLVALLCQRVLVGLVSGTETDRQHRSRFTGAHSSLSCMLHSRLYLLYRHHLTMRLLSCFSNHAFSTPLLPATPAHGQLRPRIKDSADYRVHRNRHRPATTSKGWSSLRVDPRSKVSTSTTTLHWQDVILHPNNASSVVHQGILHSEPYNLTIC